MPTRKTKNSSNKIPILISGFIGSGKSTLAKALAEKYRMKYLSGSMVHCAIMKERLHASFAHEKKIQDGFWESSMGKKGMRMRAADLSIDREVDKRLNVLMRAHPNCVSDSRLAPWLYKGKAIRIWLNASESERAKRVAGRDGISAKEARRAIHARNNTDIGIYRKLYGIRMGEDLGPFDLVVNNEGFTPAQTRKVVCNYINAQRQASH